MRMLNRLGWADGIAFESFGLRLGVRISEPGFTAQLRQALPYGARLTQECQVDHLFSLLIGTLKPGSSIQERTCVVYSDATPVARVEGLDAAVDSLKSLLRLLVGEFARDRIFVHAGVVGWHGRAILIPGRSFTGKSRLTAAFVRAGAQFYSDEYAVVSADGLVHPFAQPISIRDEGSFRGQPVAADELGDGGIGTEPLLPGLVVFACYKDGAFWRARRLSRGKAMLDLLANTVPARRRPEAALEALQQVARAAPAYRATRGEADDAVPRALRLLQRAVTG